MPKPYRSKSRLVHDVLAVLAEESPVGVTRLLTAANLTHARLQEHLAHLVARGWVQVRNENGRTEYQVSDEGRVVLKELRRVDQAMRDFGLAL